MRLTLVTTFFILLTAVARAELGADSFSPSEARVLQFLTDPANNEKAWMLTESLLQFNGDLKADGSWQVKFDAQRFERVTGIPASARYRHRRIQTTKNGGQLYLMVETELGSRSVNFLFRTGDYGESWQYSRMGRGGPNGGFTSRESPPEREPPRPPPTRRKGKEVDLRALANESQPETKAPHHGGGDRAQPLFRVLFDLLLHLRPGANPWTFDSYHTLLLVELFPRPELQFSFEVSPAPRFYELKYRATERLTIRGGRIWIPFDRMNPHNMYGGFVNTSLLRQPGSAAFLPDLWTDLGLGVDYQLVNNGSLNLLSQFYVVNGFRDGAPDPAGEVGTRYPDFENAPTLDVNGDKALGARLSGLVQNTFGLGLSAYSGRYTRNGDSKSRILMLGLDGQLLPFPGTTLTAGYIYIRASLPHGASKSHFLRGGFYVELSQKVADRWRIALRGGSSQNDNRVQDITDQNIFGGALIYDMGLFRFSFQYFRDLQKVPGKTVYEYTALRAVALF